MDTVTHALMKEFIDKNSLTHLPIDKAFECFAAYSVISSHYADEFDASECVSGNGQDLNVDAFIVNVNGKIVSVDSDIDEILDLNGYLDAEFIIIQAKSSSSFDSEAILAFGDNLAREIFSETQTVPVNDDVKRLIKIKERLLSKASKLRNNPVCHIYYVCTGNWREDGYISQIVKRKREDIVNTNLFSDVHFELIGARELQKLYRDTKVKISCEVEFERLVTLPAINGVTASYLGVLPHKEFIKLISNGKNIIKSVFIDNVRDFQGKNPVNKNIAQTITEGFFDQFVLRNNGVTIVARDINVISNKYHLKDYQIVNGCQTSNVIFENRERIEEDLFIPVKLIHTINDEVSQSIIRSTNSQTTVKENELLAFTKFQRDLEDYYKGVEHDDTRLFYERRAKQYAGNGEVEKDRIVTIGNQLKRYASMFENSPHLASRYLGTLLKDVKRKVFQPSHRPEPYFAAALAGYRFEIALRRLLTEQRDIRSFRYHLLYAFKVRYEMGPFPGAGHKTVGLYSDTLIRNHLSNLDQVEEAFNEAVLIVRRALERSGLPMTRDSAKSRLLVEEVERIASERRL